MSTTSTIRKARRATYRAARVEGDVVAVLSGTVPQRLARRLVYRHVGRLTRLVLRTVGL